MAFYANEEFREVGAPAGSGVPVCEHYSDDGFPKLLYRPGVDARPTDDDGKQVRERNLIAGHVLDTLSVRTDAMLDAALAEGWHLTVAAAVAMDDVVGEVEMARRGPGRPRRPRKEV